MIKQRGSGIVMHISSLPNPYGIGTMGKCAYDFVDFLHKAGQKYWQILPLSPTGFGDSPYQSCSSRAGNPYFIDLDLLCEDGLLLKEEYSGMDFGQDPDMVNYGKLYETRTGILRLAFERGKEKYTAEIKSFTSKNKNWLSDYALYMALKNHFAMQPLSQWPDKYCVKRTPRVLTKYRNLLAEDIAFHVFVQFLFFKQWSELKEYANKNGILIIGDIPFYVAEDSVEIWSHPKLFKLSEPGVPKAQAGVPPDLYSKTGQLWGNPVYDWRLHETDKFAWWIDRLRHSQKFYDIIRIDHFRAIHTYWEVPSGEKIATKGKWIEGPGHKLISAIRSVLPEAEIIAEDLGELDGDVRKFISEADFPGMDVLLYALNPKEDNDFFPHNTKPGRVYYTSTHDSPTFMQWLLNEADEDERLFAYNYLRLRDDEGLNWGVIKAVWASSAKLVMAPMADVLALGADARINTPATLGGQNWCWRVRKEAFNDEVAGRLADISKTYKRNLPVQLPEKPKTSRRKTAKRNSAEKKQ